MATSAELSRAKSLLLDDGEETLYDGEISDLIDAAKDRLRMAGVTDHSDTDNPSVWRYVALYCRTNFRTPPDYDKLLAAEKNLLRVLAQTAGHTEFGEGAG